MDKLLMKLGDSENFKDREFGEGVPAGFRRPEVMKMKKLLQKNKYFFVYFNHRGIL